MTGRKERSSLFDGSRNPHHNRKDSGSSKLVCHITGLPVWDRKTSKELRQLLEDAISHEAVIVLCTIDLDYLKWLNDCYGETLADDGIRQFSRAVLDAAESVSDVTYKNVFRYQAGGDEFNSIFIFSKAQWDEKKFQEQFIDCLAKPVPFMHADPQDEDKMQELTVCLGSCVATDTKGANVEELLDHIQNVARHHLREEKTKKIIRDLQELINQGRSMDDDELNRFIMERWGPKRPTPEVLGIILRLLEARLIIRLVSQIPR
jgi:diguanylate cyclase (GGDEF)-like protein